MKTNRKTSTALVRRRPAPVARRKTRKQPGKNGIVIRQPAPTLTLSDDPHVGAIGLVEVKLTKREEAVLATPVSFDDVRVKPTGQPYLSHPAYTRWFNAAFGRLGWAIAPAAKPVATAPDAEGRVTVARDYLLYIHGVAVAFAQGEHEYHEKNAEQSYGDALEATVASALRRCAKRLGVGLELWDPTFLHQFLDDRCVKVWVDGQTKPRFRRKIDPPLYKEQGASEQQPSRRPLPAGRETPAHPPAYHNKLKEPITAPQHGRLWAIAGKMHRTEEEVHAWLQQRFGFASTKVIPRELYDEIVNWLEQPGPLPPKEIR
jgi:hypothetical protein